MQSRLAFVFVLAMTLGVSPHRALTAQSTGAQAPPTFESSVANTWKALAYAAIAVHGTQPS
jgi:hypothetical protein